MTTTANSLLLTSCLQELVQHYAKLEVDSIDESPKCAQIVPIIWTPPVCVPCPSSTEEMDTKDTKTSKKNGKRKGKKNGCQSGYSSMFDLCSFQNRCAFACCDESKCPTKCNPFCPNSCTPLSCYPMCCPPNKCATSALCGNCCCLDGTENDDDASTVTSASSRCSRRSEDKCVCMGKRKKRSLSVKITPCNQPCTYWTKSK